MGAGRRFVAARAVSPGPGQMPGNHGLPDTHVNGIERSDAAGKAVLCEHLIDLNLDRVNRCDRDSAPLGRGRRNRRGRARGPNGPRAAGRVDLLDVAAIPRHMFEGFSLPEAKHGKDGRFCPVRSDDRHRMRAAVADLAAARTVGKRAAGHPTACS